MFFQKKSSILFREYDSFGHITDGSNYIYRKERSSNPYLGSKIISKSASLFFSALDRAPKHIDDISQYIHNIYKDTEIETIKSDAMDFYLLLEKDGFVLSGPTAEDCKSKDLLFSYQANTKIQTGKEQIINKPVKTTFDFLNEKLNGIPRLENIHIEITSKCNERCIHCYIPHETKIDSMDPCMFYNILDQCKDMKLLHLAISGGEPMLHRDFRQFLRKCREYDLSVSVLSNLTLLNENIIEEMKKNPLLGVQTSLYSMNPVIHDMITNSKGSFERTKESILKLRENDIPLQISCPIVKQNQNCYQDVISWAEQHNIPVSSDFVIISEFSHTAKNLNCRLSIKEVENIIRLDSLHNNAYFDAILEEAERKKKLDYNDGVCSVCSSSICITESGSVYPCAGWRGYVVGHIKDNSLSEIWRKSDEIRYLRRLTWSSFPKCMECSDKDFCTMCMVRNSNEHPSGDPLTVSEYFCNIAHINKRIFLERADQKVDDHRT